MRMLNYSEFHFSFYSHSRVNREFYLIKNFLDWKLNIQSTLIKVVCVCFHSIFKGKLTIQALHVAITIKMIHCDFSTGHVPRKAINLSNVYYVEWTILGKILNTNKQNTKKNHIINTSSVERTEPNSNFYFICRHFFDLTETTNMYIYLHYYHTFLYKQLHYYPFSNILNHIVRIVTKHKSTTFAIFENTILDIAL